MPETTLKFNTEGENKVTSANRSIASSLKDVKENFEKMDRIKSKGAALGRLSSGVSKLNSLRDIGSVAGIGLILSRLPNIKEMLNKPITNPFSQNFMITSENGMAGVGFYKPSMFSSLIGNLSPILYRFSDKISGIAATIVPRLAAFLGPVMIALTTIAFLNQEKIKKIGEKIAINLMQVKDNILASLIKLFPSYIKPMVASGISDLFDKEHIDKLVLPEDINEERRILREYITKNERDKAIITDQLIRINDSFNQRTLEYDETVRYYLVNDAFKSRYQYAR